MFLGLCCANCNLRGSVMDVCHHIYQYGYIGAPCPAYNWHYATDHGNECYRCVSPHVYINLNIVVLLV